MRHKLSTWSDADDALLIDLIGKGVSAREIADRLGGGGGQTRNAVIGRAARMGVGFQTKSGWPQRGGMSAPRQKAISGTNQHVVSVARVQARAASVAPQLRVRASEPEALGPVEEFSPAGTCRWIHGDVAAGGWRCCGQPGFPWCAHHAARASGRTVTQADIAAHHEATHTYGHTQLRFAGPSNE